MMTSMIMAREGVAATVIPVVVLEAMGPFKGTVSLPLVEPDLGKSICLLTAARMPGLPTVEALRRALDTLSS
jgi:DNA-binding transcriptional LysR family regulator